MAVGWVEGIEINFLGLVAGLDLRRPAIKLPGWGRIGMDPRVRGSRCPAPSGLSLKAARPSSA